MSQPGGLQRLGKKLTEGKEGPMVLRREKGKGNLPKAGRKKMGKGKTWVCFGE